MQLLHIEDLVVEYPGPVLALDGLNLSLQPGEVVCLLGANGAGKTTLLKTLCGLVVPKSGRVQWGTPGGKRPQLGVLLEGSRAFYWNLTGWENAGYFAALKGLSVHDLESHLNELFHLVGLWEARDRLAGDYSSGMKKRLSLLIALLGSPEMVMLDEPTAGLDREAVLEFEDYLIRVIQQGTAILCATHELSFAFTVATRMMYLDAGQLHDWDWTSLMGRHRRVIFLLGGELDSSEVESLNGYVRTLGDARWQLDGAAEDPLLFQILQTLVAEQGLHLLQVYGVD